MHADFVAKASSEDLPKLFILYLILSHHGNFKSQTLIPIKQWASCFLRDRDELSIACCTWEHLNPLQLQSQSVKLSAQSNSKLQTQL